LGLGRSSNGTKSLLLIGASSDSDPKSLISYFIQRQRLKILEFNEYLE
jgi:hypothetical protein